MPPSATPLKVGSTSNTPARPAAPERSGTATPSASGAGKAATPAGAPPDISSPHELTAFVSLSHSPLLCRAKAKTDRRQVENLLEQLDSKFDEMSTQILDRSTSSRLPILYLFYELGPQ